MKHGSHPDIVIRLRRAEGHLRSIITMIENGRGCVELAQQLQAVEQAVGNAKRELIHDHINHCFDDLIGETSEDAKVALKDFKKLAKYL